MTNSLLGKIPMHVHSELHRLLVEYVVVGLKNVFFEISLVEKQIVISQYFSRRWEHIYSRIKNQLNSTRQSKVSGGGRGGMRTHLTI